MTVYVVTWERNTESVNGEMFAVLGVFFDPTSARRCAWREMREQLRQGVTLWGRRTEAAGGDWDAEIKTEAHEVGGQPRKVPVYAMYTRCRSWDSIGELFATKEARTASLHAFAEECGIDVDGKDDSDIAGELGEHGHEVDYFTDDIEVCR